MKVLVMALLLMMMIPAAAAAAGFDAYGYNETACIFNGTFDNWENFVYGRAPSPPVDPSATDVQFLIRQWDQNFDQAMFHGEPWEDGAWQQAHFYEYLSGEQLDWTWNWKFKIVYSSTPIEDGLDIGDNFYVIQDETWLTDPEGNEIILNEQHAIPPSLGLGYYQ